jgi:hypothetical protein
VKRSLGFAVALVSAFALSVPTAAAATGPTIVLKGPEDQSTPFVNATYLVWTQDSIAHPGRDHAYGRTPVLGATGRFRMDDAGSSGVAGGIDPDRDRAIYQQITGPESDLYWFDLVAGTRRRLPSVVNTGRWERDPRVSSTFMLFARDTPDAVSLFLWRRGTTTLDRIASYGYATSSVFPGSVGDRYATWTRCSPVLCSVYVYDTDTATTTRYPTRNERSQYAPVLDEGSGMLYFVRSGSECGSSVGIWRRTLDLSGRGVRLATLPAGIDTGWTLSLDHVSGRLDLWFSRFRCGSHQGDLAKLRDVGASALSPVRAAA